MSKYQAIADFVAAYYGVPVLSLLEGYNTRYIGPSIRASFDDGGSYVVRNVPHLIHVTRTTVE